MRYACIAAHRAEYPVRLMCRVLVVSRGGFYAWLERAPSRRAQTDARLRVAIRAIHAESRRSYGSPRIHRELRAQGQCHGRKRIARLMRVEGLRAKRSRRYRVTTRRDATHPAAPNTLGRQFAVREVNRVWAGDVTACWTSEGWLYLAALLDLGSRRVVGWATSGTLDQTLTQRALRRALVQRQPAAGLLHHSDRGTPYTAVEYQAALRTAHVAVSMSRPGDCWDNAVMESFWGTLKTELVNHEHYATHEQARTSLFEYIEVFYNRKRLHSSLGYVSPETFEASLN